MHTSRINLFQKTEEYKRIARIFSGVRVVFGFVLTLLLAIFVAFFSYTQSQQKILSDLVREHNKLQRQIITTKADEAELLYFSQKEKQLRDILKEDVQFLPYYNRVLSAVKNFPNSSGAKLSAIDLNKNREVLFTVKFDTYEAFVDFLTYVESEQFLSYFTDLKITNFYLTRDRAQRNYALDFTGKFQPITNEAK